MIFSPLRLLSAFLSLAVIGVLVTTIVLFIVSLTGDPGSCEDPARPITANPAQAASFQQKWDQLNATLAEIAQLVAAPEVCDRLMAAGTPEAVVRIVQGRSQPPGRSSGVST